jgi:hypothetical protein
MTKLSHGSDALCTVNFRVPRLVQISSFWVQLCSTRQLKWKATAWNPSLEAALGEVARGVSLQPRQRRGLGRAPSSPSEVQDEALHGRY